MHSLRPSRMETAMTREQIYKAALEREAMCCNGRCTTALRCSAALEAAAKVGDEVGALLVRRATELCHAIELLPASQQQTAVSIAASNLRFDIDAYLRGAR